MEREFDVGIVGDGQLGRMLVQAGHEMVPPLSFITLGAGEVSPSSLVGASQITAGEGALFSLDGMDELARSSEVVTWEVEHIDSSYLEVLALAGCNVQSSPATLGTIRDKLTQKQMLKDGGIPVASFTDLPSSSGLTELLTAGTEVTGRDLMLKLRAGGFDGRGNAFLPKGSSSRTLTTAFWDLKNRDAQDGGIYVEGMVDLEQEHSGEISVIAARGQRDSDLALYEAVDSYHKNSICLKTVAPSQHSPELRRQAAELTHDTMKLLHGFGVFTVEMFVTAEGELLVNEIAPRVHNSGHHTIHSAETSQFEQHLRAITGRELGSPRLKVPHAVMVNILGRTESPDINWQVEKEPQDYRRIHVVHYQKSPRPDRKIGHITATPHVDESVERTVQRAEEFRERILV